MKINEDGNSNRETLYSLDNVSRTYALGKTTVTAVKGITLSILKGDVVSIEGASGSGKSTLLLLLGILEVPSTGTITFDGKNLTQAKDKELTELRSTTIGYVFQQFNLIPTLTAIDNVGVAMIPHHVSKEKRVARATTLLEQVGLGHRLNHLPSSMSGGEQQRVAIARALANKPGVIIADEPTGNLDSASGAEIINLLNGLQKSDGITIIIATHDHDVSEQAHRTLKMKDGSIISDVQNAPYVPSSN